MTQNFQKASLIKRASRSVARVWKFESGRRWRASLSSLRCKTFVAGNVATENPIKVRPRNFLHTLLCGSRNFYFPISLDEITLAVCRRIRGIQRGACFFPEEPVISFWIPTWGYNWSINHELAYLNLLERMLWFWEVISYWERFFFSFTVIVEFETGLFLIQWGVWNLSMDVQWILQNSFITVYKWEPSWKFPHDFDLKIKSFRNAKVSLGTYPNRQNFVICLVLMKTSM